jgi:class 3 adenylate cyclase
MRAASGAGGDGGGPETVRLLAERMLALEEPLLAFDVLTVGLEHHPGDVRLRQLLGLALARSASAARANAVLQELEREGHASAETLGLLARTWKDLWRQAADPERGREFLVKAAADYARAYAAAVREGLPGPRAWTGINAATTALLLGDDAAARALALEVGAFCIDALARPDGDDRARYWLLATIAEAALIRHEVNEAEEWYARAAAEVGGRFGDLGTTRRQARLLLQHFDEDPRRLDHCFKVPRVVTFTGHMIDRPGRPTPRFPPAREGAVRDAIATQLKELDAGFGYASAACGSDILFHEAMLERGADVHIVLPYRAEDFRRDSVDVLAGAEWGARFDRVLARATTVVTATEQTTSGAAATYDYANMLLEGLGAIRARQLGADVSLLAVWDGRPGDGPGGTETIVRRWRALGRDTRIVPLGDTGPATAATAAPAVARAPAATPELSKDVVAMLFADAVGFSRLSEEQVPRFVSDFLGTIGELVARTPHAPVLRNTWGDGLYFVFASVASAGQFALDLRDVIDGIRWTERGLPASLGLRIAIHAGPAYQCIDPVSGRLNYIGSHVSRAARIEPITPPGQVYASQSFVAIAAAYGVSALEWDYVGLVPLAKAYGTVPMYHLQRPLRGRR